MGVYVRLGTEPDRLPCVGWVKTVYVSGYPCGEVAVSVIFTGVSCTVKTVWFEATGAVEGFSPTMAVCHPMAELYWKAPL